MLEWMPSLDEDRPFRILCLGAHSDDVEIGCGGTMLQMAAGDRELEVRWEVFSGNVTRAEEARYSAEYWLSGIDRREIMVHSFRDGFFPDEWARIKIVFEEIKSAFDPDLIFTHHSGDMHQDHRTVCELTWNTFRNHAILEYEIPKYDGDLNTPSVYVPVSAETARRKADALLNYFSSQVDKHWFCEELFLGLMRLRGMESCAPSGYAEGFHSRKLALCI
jgi:LmbE family N-acetylglucosaminyl deacetylase